MSRLDLLIQGVTLTEVLSYVKPISAKYLNTMTIKYCFESLGETGYGLKEEIVECLDSILT